MKAKALDLVVWLRRHVPRPLLPLLVAMRFKVAWATKGVRADARTQMSFLLERARPDADIERAARAYVRGQMWRGEARWHPEMLTNRRIVGLEHLQAARDLGRGVMLNFMHHGAYEGAFGSLGRRGVQLHMVVYPYMTRPDAPRWLRQHMSVACAGGGQAISAEIGTQGIIELLNQGKVVALASDVPGRTPLRFVDREVMGSFGAARIAADAGSPVVVLTSESDERGPFVRLHERLEPKDFASPKDLLQEMVTRHERVHLQWPEHTDLPLSRWGSVEAAGD